MPDDDKGATEGEATKAEKKPKPRKKASKAKKSKKAPEAGASADDVGKLTFDPSIVTSIAITEAQKIDGIIELTGSFMDDWVLRRGKGVHVEEEASDEGGEAYSLDLKLSVEYGVDCVKLAEKVRERIAKEIKRVTGRDTRKIDIHVTGIGHKEAPAEPHEDEPVAEGTGIDF